MACRFLKVSTSGYYDWASRPASARAIADADLRNTIRRIHTDSRQTYGAPRVLAELRLGLGVHVGRKRLTRLMRLDGLVGVSHRRKRRGWKPDTATHEDLVKRRFRAEAPNRLWFCDSVAALLPSPAPRQGRMGLLRCRDRRVQPSDRGLVDQ